MAAPSRSRRLATTRGRPIARLFAAARRVAGALRDGTATLHICSACGGTFACPVDWRTVGPARWRIALRCGECGHWREVVVSDRRAACLERWCTRPADAMRRAVVRCERERMLAEIDAFAAALADGRIDAGDFSL
jgi:hypothetical protein